MARPTKYTPEVVKKLCDAIALGAAYRLACYYAGISEDTFEIWRRTRSGFSDMIAAAEGRGATGWLAKIEKAASDGDWRAAAWKLERRYPKLYGRLIQEHTGSDGGPIEHHHTVDLSKLSDEELAQLEQLVRRTSSDT